MVHSVTFKKGALLYKRTQRRIDRIPNGTQWFAITLGYGSAESYGQVISTWRLQRNVKLLNISKESYRDEIFTFFKNTRTEGLLREDLSCDWQYAGSRENARFHRHIAPFLKHHKLDGTYINEDESDMDCAGATEVVLNVDSSRMLTKL